MIEFAVLAAVLVASALFTVTARRPVHSVVGLLVNFIALAITYLSLQAEFIGLIQIVVYSGAILILFVFVIALLSSGVRPFVIGPDKMSAATVPVAVVLSAVSAGLVAFTAVRNGSAPPGATGATGTPESFGSVVAFGDALFTRNLLPFEVTAFILMVAVIGVVLIAGDVDAPPRRKRSRTDREPIVKPEPARR